MPKTLLALLTAAATALSLPGAASAGAAPSPPLDLATFTWPELRYAKANGIRIGYRVIGEGRPLVLIMGTNGTAIEWDPAFVIALANQGRKVVVFDNRGVGFTSDTPGDRLSVAEQADDTAGLIRAAGFERADVLGWSMGAFIAQELVLRHPAVVRRMVLASGSAGSQHSPASTNRRVNRIFALPNPTTEQITSVIFPPDQAAAGQAFYARVGEVAVRSQLPAQAFDVPGRIALAQTRATVRDWNCRGCGTWARLPKVKRPTLVGFGRKDVIVPPVNARILTRRIPGARRVGYPDAGHAFLFQDRRPFAARVDRFLD